MRGERLHNRQSIRLQGYDYSRPGFYFITICVQNMRHVFGKVVDGKMILNKYGQIAWDEWFKTVTIRNNVRLDEFVVMPNHIHGIIEIISPPITPFVQANRDSPPRIDANNDNSMYRAKFESPSYNIGAIIRGYKSSATKQINLLRKTPGTKLWQRNYYDHIIRNEESLYHIREYIKYNPINWNSDRFFKS